MRGPGFTVLAPALAALAAVAVSLTAAPPPAPYGATPSARQLRWHELEFYGFLHFTVNTFTDREWGEGDEDERLFNPTDFDANQIASTFAEAGMRGLILTCKHHDGFCLWPSRYTEHSVKRSPWKGGKGDVVAELSAACRRRGLRFGVYLSPWDRNHAEYGRPAYVTYYRDQLRELLTRYGPVFVHWCDGANGGSGYYGGAREERRIDAARYYDWTNTWAVAYGVQRDLVVFSDVGPEVRWVGNEHGEAGDPCWATYTPRTTDGSPPAPGRVKYQDGFNGHRDGRYWLPAEVDVSIRPGWFYHAREDARVRSPENLLQLYFQSVGRGAALNLNVPPDRTGRIHSNDVAALRGFKQRFDAIFGADLARTAKATASNIRGHDRRYAAARATDGRRETYWATDDNLDQWALELAWPAAVTFNVISLREHLPLGQRVDQWALDAWRQGQWAEFAAGSSIGSRRLWRGADQTTDRLRLRIVKASACPAIAELGVHRDPGPSAAR